MQSIEITNKTKEEIEELKEGYPNGHIKTEGDKTYWVFESKVEFGV